MINDQFTNTLWTRFVVDHQMVILEVSNFNDKLFFGKQPIIGNAIDCIANKDNADQVNTIVQGLRKAMSEKRNTCFVYTSNNSVNVCVHVEYRNDNKLSLYLTEINRDDLLSAQKSNTTLQTLYEDLPIGVEIFDKHGCLIEVNNKGVRDAGAKNKEDLLGICFFDNPFLPEDAKVKILAGENARFVIDYDFNRLADLFKTSRKDVVQIDVSISIVKDNKGEVDRYIIISQDITDHIQLKRDYESLYNQNATIINSLPVGVGIYSCDGTMTYSNQTLCQIFGVEKGALNPININNSPAIPQVFKDAVRDGTPIHISFPYNFDEVTQLGYLKTTNKHIKHIECNGKPILNYDGKTDSYVFIMRDVTSDVINDEALRQNRQKTGLAIKAADIMLWEFDVASNLFYSENEECNNYDSSEPITVEEYIKTMHPEDVENALQIMQRMTIGDDYCFNFDIRVIMPNSDQWQYCNVNGSPYEYDSSGKVVKYVGTRKNNTELHKKKQLQETILNSIPLSIHIKDVEDNSRYLFCNDESKKIFGIRQNATAYDIISSDHIDLVTKTDREVYYSGEPYLGSERITIKDGRTFDTFVIKSVIEDNNKRLLLSIRWDQSIQEELKRRSKLFTLSLETMTAYTWFYEPEKDLITYGDEFNTIGQDPFKINTLDKFASLLHPSDVNLFVDTLASILDNDSGIWHVEYRADVNNDGVYTWWETRGIVETTTINNVESKYVFGMTICTEPHKQTELTLRKNEEELSKLIRQNDLILNNTNSGLAYITADYVVQWENISICSVDMPSEAYRKGELCFKSAHNRDTPCENCVLQRAFVSHKVEQMQFTVEDGSMIEVFATPVFSNADTIEGVVIRMDDVTEREKMIEEFRQAKALAERSDKLKSAFLANMSHEIRTPLNAIVGFSELMMISEDKEDHQEYINIIKDNNSLLLKLINDILDLSKIESGFVEFTYEEFDIAEYFDGIVTSMRQRVPNPNVRLLAFNPHTSCKVNLDKNRVAQIMTNYVTNSIKYTPKGFIEMGYESSNEGIKLYVKDSGIGIPDDKKSKVFHRFAKLDEFAQGTGLGLSICKAIVESMNGSVGFESKQGEGSTFWAFLPCEPIVENANKEQQISASANSGMLIKNINYPAQFNGKTIVIAEDIHSNFLLLSAILGRQFNILHAHNGEQAIKLVSENNVDLVFMDMKMPIMDGLTATAEIRKFNKELPIIALTAHAFETDQDAALKVGCNEYLVKPIDKERLMLVLRKYCYTSKDV